MNWVSYLPFPFNITNHKKVLEFRQKKCHWNVLIVLEGIDKYPFLNPVSLWIFKFIRKLDCRRVIYQYPTRLIHFKDSPICLKIGEPPTNTWKLSTIIRWLSSLKLFSLKKFWIKDSFCCTNVKIKFYFFRYIYEISGM